MTFSLEVLGFFLFSLSTTFPQQAHLKLGGTQTNPVLFFFKTLSPTPPKMFILVKSGE